MPAARWEAGLRAPVVNTFPGGCPHFLPETPSSRRAAGARGPACDRNRGFLGGTGRKKKKERAPAAGPRVTAAQGSARVLALPLTATCRGLFTARVRDSHSAEPTPGPKPRPPRPSAPLLPPKLINSRLPPCQALPLAPFPSNENPGAVSPGSRSLNKQTNCPAAVLALHPGAARDGLRSAPAATSRPLQPMEPGLWRPHPAPIAGRAPLRPSPPPPPAPSCLRGLLGRTSVAGQPRLLPSVLPRPTGPELHGASRPGRRRPRLSGPPPPPLHTLAGGGSRPSTAPVAGAAAAAA